MSFNAVRPAAPEPEIGVRLGPTSSTKPLAVSIFSSPELPQRLVRKPLQVLIFIARHIPPFAPILLPFSPLLFQHFLVAEFLNGLHYRKQVDRSIGFQPHLDGGGPACRPVTAASIVYAREDIVYFCRFDRRLEDGVEPIANLI